MLLLSKFSGWSDSQNTVNASQQRCEGLGAQAVATLHSPVDLAGVRGFVGEEDGSCHNRLLASAQMRHACGFAC